MSAEPELEGLLVEELQRSGTHADDSLERLQVGVECPLDLLERDAAVLPADPQLPRQPMAWRRPTRTLGRNPGSRDVKVPSAIPWRTIRSSSGRCRLAARRLSFSRTIALSSESQTRMTPRTRSLRSALYWAIPPNTASSFRGAGSPGSSRSGSTLAIAWSAMRSTTALASASLDSK